MTAARSACLKLLLAALLSACASPGLGSAPSAPSSAPTAVATLALPSITPPPGLHGHLWFDRTSGDVWQVDLATGRATQVSIPPDVFPIQPAVPPSGAPLSFVGESMVGGVISGHYDLYIGSQRVITGDDRLSYEDPAWSADGKRLYFTRIGVPPGSSITRTSGLNIQVLDIGSGLPPRTVVTEALQPAPDRADQWLAYVSFDLSQPQSLAKSIRARNLSSGEDRLVLSAGHFDDIFGPRWMPNGAQLVFSALDSLHQSRNLPNSRNSQPALGIMDFLLAQANNLFGAHVAAAHSWVGDVWQVNTDGSGLTRLTQQHFTAPIAAPAPDGQHIAIAALDGLWVMNADGSGLTKMSDTGSNGNLCWSA